MSRQNNMQTKYIFPLINIAPPGSYKMVYRFPIEDIQKHLDKNITATLRTEHKHFFKGKIIKTESSILQFDGKKWNDKRGLYYVCKSENNSLSDWYLKKDIEYIESNAEIVSNGYFNNVLKYQPHQNYAVYLSKSNTTFISDGQFKFGAERTIAQMKSFGKWVEGYPDTNYSVEKDTDQSLIFINPYNGNAKIKIQLINDKVIKKNITIPSLRSFRIPISSLLPKCKNWSGRLLKKR